MTLIPAFFSLLHLSEEPGSGNLSNSNQVDRIKTYVDCAITLDRSLRFAGARLKLLTNRAAQVRSVLDGYDLSIEEISFNLDVPPGIPFYSAHFKVDAFRYFASLRGVYAILLDLDMVMLNPMPAEFRTLASRGIPAYYDITSQILPAYGSAKVSESMRALNPGCFENRWAGGEFLGGSAEFYASLVKHVDDTWSQYRSSYPSLFHIGDEMIVSVALERMRRDGWYISDVGALGVVARFWSGAVRHRQLPFGAIVGAAFLHLPQDKSLLAKQAKGFERSRFLRIYGRWRKYRLLRKTVSTLIRSWK